VYAGKAGTYPSKAPFTEIRKLRPQKVLWKWVWSLSPFHFDFSIWDVFAVVGATTFGMTTLCRALKNLAFCI
jgi:hypothetical protein